jgi:hypothetical protein
VKHSRKKGRKVGKSKQSVAMKSSNIKTLPTTGTNTTPIKIPSKYQLQKLECHSVLSSASSEEINISFDVKHHLEACRTGSNIAALAQREKETNEFQEPEMLDERMSIQKRIEIPLPQYRKRKRELAVYKPELDARSQEDFNLFLRYEALNEPTIFELAELFNKLNRHFLPKVHAPDKARELFQTNYQIPKCYQVLTEAFTKLELTLFNMIHNGDKLTYTRIRSLIFEQSRL